MHRFTVRAVTAISLVAVIALGAFGPAQAQDVELRRIDLAGNVEGVDPAFDPVANGLAELDLPFTYLGFPYAAPNDIFPDMHGNVSKYYFEFVFPAGVTSVKSVTVFDDHDPAIPPGDPGSCVTGSASFGIFTGPEILGFVGYDNAGGAIYPVEVGRYLGGTAVPFPDLLDTTFVEFTDLDYGTVNADATVCSTYPHVRGTDMTPLPHTGGLAGATSMALGQPISTEVWGALQVTDDCDGDMVNDLVPAPIYPAGFPGKRASPGFKSIGCGGSLTLNFEHFDGVMTTGQPAFAKAGSGIAGADLIVYEVGLAEEVLGVAGSSTEIGPINQNADGGIITNCADLTDTTTASIVLTNNTDSVYGLGGSGIDWNEWRLRVVTPGPAPTDITIDEMDFIHGGSISGTVGSNTKTIGGLTVNCESIFYFYTWFDDSAVDDGDGDGEHVFSSPVDATGISFTGFTGIGVEPSMFDATLTSAGPATTVLEGGVSTVSNVYAFSIGTAIGTASLISGVGCDLNPNTLNLGSKGEWITAYIEPNGGVLPEDIDPATIVCQGEDPTQDVPVDTSAAWAVGDGNNNGVPDLMVKIPRAPLPGILEVGDEILITLRGETFGGARWAAQDTIRVIEPKN